MKLIRSFAYAFNGIKICFTSEVNFKIHIVIAIFTIVSGLVFRISGIEWLAVTFCIAFVTAMEMINTALEKLCDMVHQDIHPVIKMIKDIAAGAVLLAAIGSLITGTFIFLPKLMNYIKLL